MTMAAHATHEILTPSEAVFFYGDRFVTQSMLGEKLLLADIYVSTNGLAKAMMTAAILGNVECGFVRLSIEKRRTLFGLIKTEKLKVAPANGSVSWPDQTTEHGLLQVLGGNIMNADDLIIAYLGKESSSPQSDYITRVKGGLVERGIISAESTKVLGLNIGTHVTMSPNQRARIEENGPSRVISLIGEVEKGQPELLAQIRKSVAAAFANRTESARG